MDESFEETKIPPKKTSVASIALPRLAASMDPGDEQVPEARKQHELEISLFTSDKKPVSVQRDAHGRFAPKNSAPLRDKDPDPEYSSSMPSKRRRASSASETSSQKPLSVVRDAHGRFAPKMPSPMQKLDPEHCPVTPGPLKQSSTLIKSAKRQSSVARDSRSISVPRKGGSVNLKEAPRPIFPKGCSSASKLLGEEPLSVERDANGRFVAKSKPIGTTKKPPAKSPYFIPPPKIPKAKVIKAEGQSSTQDTPRTPKKDRHGDNQSPQSSAKKRTPGKTVSCIPFPPLSAPHFGLIQEKLADDPFRLLIAVTFLIKTRGKQAIPVFYELMEKYPTPDSLVDAEKEDIVPIIHHLGLQNQRASTYQTYAAIWVETPPEKGKRYAVRGYPSQHSGRDVKKGDVLSDEDEREAWEIGHMTQGPYAIDSWRIFCRDVLRGIAKGWNGEGSTHEGFQPEWMRVVPEDKELRAYLRWMWLKEGFEWDPFTGEKEIASPELTRAAMEGRVAWDDKGGMRIVDEVIEIPIGVSQLSANEELSGQVSDDK